MTHHNYFNQFL